MTRNKKIAVTGGICSGKSEVSKNIREFGFRVFSCDEIYEDMLREGFFTNELVAEFGREILTGDGNVSKSKISEIVFRDEKKLKILTELTNPKVMRRTLDLMDNEPVEKDRLTFTEVPLLFENGYEKYFDVIIVVIRSYENRLKCVEKRYRLDEEWANKRISCQYDYDGNDLAGYMVVHNDGTLAGLRENTKKIIAEIKSQK